MSSPSEPDGMRRLYGIRYGNLYQEHWASEEQAMAWARDNVTGFYYSYLILESE